MQGRRALSHFTGLAWPILPRPIFTPCPMPQLTSSILMHSTQPCLIGQLDRLASFDLHFKKEYLILCKCFDRESFNNIVFMPAPRTADYYQRSWDTIFELVQYLLQVTTEPNRVILFLCSILIQNNMVQSQQKARILLFKCINKVQL